MKRDEVGGLRFLVFGAARSGVAAARLLMRNGADVVVADGKPLDEAGAVRLELDALGIESFWGDAARELIEQRAEETGICVHGENWRNLTQRHEDSKRSKRKTDNLERANETDRRGEEPGDTDSLNMAAQSGMGERAAGSGTAVRDVMVKSPGIPQTNPLVMLARAAGMRVISEIELASAFVPQGVRTIAITGTNGKTTTTAMTAHVLNACGYRAILAGNIGDAWCNRVEDVGDMEAASAIFVVEVSSFQLEDLEDFSPQVAMLTNISPDHMDRYDDRMDLYVGAKANILRNFCSDSIFIWNAADAASSPVAERCVGRVWSFHSGMYHEGLAAGVLDGQVMLGNVAVLPVKELPLPGKHNLENALCAVLAAAAVGAKAEDIAEGLRSFPGVEHRIELCGVRSDGVRFYNDSKATNLDAMEKAVLAFDEPIVLIAGGRDAHSDYGSLSELVRAKVSQLVTLGEAAELIESAWGSLVPTRRAGSMAEAVKLANEVARPSDVVVFSPACKSFDMYANFEERGRDFKRVVERVI